MTTSVYIMKILITGVPGAGKSNFARYLHSKNPTYDLIDFQNFDDRHSFERAVLDSEKCIVVIQHSKFFITNISFDRHYVATRSKLNEFQLSDGFLHISMTTKEMMPFFDKRLSHLF